MRSLLPWRIPTAGISQRHYNEVQCGKRQRQTWTTFCVWPAAACNEVAKREMTKESAEDHRDLKSMVIKASKFQTGCSPYVLLCFFWNPGYHQVSNIFGKREFCLIQIQH